MRVGHYKEVVSGGEESSVASSLWSRPFVVSLRIHLSPKTKDLSQVSVSVKTSLPHLILDTGYWILAIPVRS